MSKRMDTANRSNRVGRLDSLVSFRYRDLTAPKFGEVDFGTDPVDHIEVEARVKSTSGTKLFRGVAADIQITHTITTRFAEGLNDDMWIELLGGKLLDILLIENVDEQDRWLRFTCANRGDKENAASRV